MYDSLAPNSTKFAKFCKHLAIITNERPAAGGGGSEINNNIKVSLGVLCLIKKVGIPENGFSECSFQTPFCSLNPVLMQSLNMIKGSEVYSLNQVFH